jgi:hypothetical protein
MPIGKLTDETAKFFLIAEPGARPIPVPPVGDRICYVFSFLSQGAAVADPVVALLTPLVPLIVFGDLTSVGFLDHANRNPYAACSIKNKINQPATFTDLEMLVPHFALSEGPTPFMSRRR